MLLDLEYKQVGYGGMDGGSGGGCKAVNRQAPTYLTQGRCAQGSTFLAQLTNAVIAGNDGVILQPSWCRVHTGATGVYTNLAANLQLHAVWDTRGPQGQYQWHDHFTRQSRPQAPSLPKVSMRFRGRNDWRVCL